MERWVDVSFDCLPLRSITRLDVPIDASPRYRAKCERLKGAISKHGTFNTYYLHNAHCVFHLTNQRDVGMLEYQFEGTLLTDGQDLRAESCDLEIVLKRETCDWLTEPIVQWFNESVVRAVLAEFNLYIEAGDLKKTLDRLNKLQQQTDESGGFMGMYL